MHENARSLPLVAASLLLATLLAGGASWAQSPPDAGRLLEETEKAAPKPLPKLPVGRITVTEPAPRETDETKVFVKGFVFSLDAPVASSAELRSLVADFTNRELTFRELDEVTTKVARHLRDKGYFLAQAYLPRQEIVDGTVRVRVMVGKAERVGGKAVELMLVQTRLREGVVQGIMEQAVPSGEPLQLERLERGILLVNDLPGITAVANLSPGSMPGTSKVGVMATEGHLVTASLGFDTFGNRFTGQERFVGSLNVNDPFGFGDQFTFSGVQAGEPVFNVNGGRMDMWRAGWQGPLGITGLRGGAAYTSLDYHIGESFADSNSRGNAETWTVNAAYPVIRTRQQSMYASLVYEYKSLLDKALPDLLGSDVVDDKRISVVTAGVQGSLFDDYEGGGYTSYGFSLAGGNLDLSNSQSNLAADLFSRKTAGGYWKINLNGARQQTLGDGFSLFLSGAAQYAPQNLDSSEQMTLGGPTGVRAYPTGEASGDDGLQASLELRLDLGTVPYLGQLQAAAFYDFGWIRQHAQTWDNWNGGVDSVKNSYSLSGTGLGLTVEKAALYQVKAFWAAKLGDNPGRGASGSDSDGRSLNSRFWLQASAFF
jgi:hemolysin activation/secretion protein